MQSNTFGTITTSLLQLLTAIFTYLMFIGKNPLNNTSILLVFCLIFIVVLIKQQFTVFGAKLMLSFLSKVNSTFWLMANSTFMEKAQILSNKFTQQIVAVLAQTCIKSCSLKLENIGLEQVKTMRFYYLLKTIDSMSLYLRKFQFAIKLVINF